MAMPIGQHSRTRMEEETLTNRAKTQRFVVHFLKNHSRGKAYDILFDYFAISRIQFFILFFMNLISIFSIFIKLVFIFFKSHFYFLKLYIFMLLCYWYAVSIGPCNSLFLIECQPHLWEQLKNKLNDKIESMRFLTHHPISAYRFYDPRAKSAYKLDNCLVE